MADKKQTKTNRKLEQALTVQRSGDYRAADVLFRQILNTDAHNVVALYSLGVNAVHLQQPAKALGYFDRAGKIKPDFALIWLNRGIVLSSLQKYAEAVESYDRALSVDPSCESAAANRNSLLAALGKPDTGPVMESEPLNAEALAREGLLLQEKGLLKEAEEIFLKILAVMPEDFVSLYSLGIIAHQDGRASAALDFLNRTAKVKPNYAPTWYNRGIVLNSLKRNDEALESYDLSLKIDPTYSEAYVNRGAVLQEMNRHVDALENYDRLLKLQPENDKALGNMGILLTEFKRFDEAIGVFEKLLRVNPDYDYGLGSLCFAQLHACQWDRLEEYVALISKGIEEERRSSKTLAVLAISDVPAEHLRCARIFADHMYPPQQPIWQGEIYHHKKIKVAYVSPDLREHPVGHLMAGIFQHHDKSKFDIIGISLGIDDRSTLRSRISGACEQFIDVRQKTTLEVARLMRDLEVDIAVDLAGYTADSRTGIFAYRPAPVQVNYLGYPSTLGVDYIDYLIADRHVIPPEDFPCFSEKIAYLPDTYLPTDDTLKVAERTPTRAEFGLPESGFVFCSFNHGYKINPRMFDVWMRILKNTPGSVLWLMKLNNSAEANVRREAEARGVDSGRIIFATRVPLVEDHLARYRLADLFLDTTPYNAHTTASDALFVGLPVLTYRGNAFAGRVASGLLSAVGLDEMIASSLAEYEELALNLATKDGLLSGIKEKLANNKHVYPLFKTERFCRNLESVYTTMWERAQKGLGPEAF